jgi:hypothetical protein
MSHPLVMSSLGGLVSYFKSLLIDRTLLSQGMCHGYELDKLGVVLCMAVSCGNLMVSDRMHAVGCYDVCPTTASFVLRKH